MAILENSNWVILILHTFCQSSCHFRRVTTKQYTYFSEFISHNTFSVSYYKLILKNAYQTMSTPPELLPNSTIQ